ncbi:MAG: hypothetical protein IJS91_06765 [Bacteroidales bacterium]|nr:hypothetical protein [Bacteroidales bacterium]
MKRTLTLLLATLVLAACGSKFDKNPIAQALTAHILASNPAGCQFMLTDLKLVDSTTFATEFDRREEVFKRQIEKNEELYVRYKTDGQPKNAALKLQAMKNGVRILMGIDSLRRSMEANLSQTAYYDYRFSGHLTKGRQSADYDGWWFTLTPSGEVLVVVSDRKDLHKTGGKAIPGYLDLLKGDSQE